MGSLDQKTHQKPRGAPRAKYIEADVDRAVQTNKKLRVKWHNKKEVTYAMVIHESGWKFSESALRREFQKRRLKSRPLRRKLNLTPEPLHS